MNNIAQAKHQTFFTAKPEQENKKIHQIRFETLERSRETSVRRVLHTTEGQLFSANVLDNDLHDLYNTNVLYDINAEIETLENNELDIIIHLKDKWTLIPFFGAQGGGGSVVFGGGLIESNLLGTLTYSRFSAYNYNGAFCYDFILSQDYLAGSRYRAGVEFLSEVYKVQSKSTNGSENGKYVWSRNLKQMLLGVRPYRWMIFESSAAIFEDGLQENEGTTANIYTGTQYKLTPQVILGEINQFNFLEEGAESRIQFSTANGLTHAPNYQSFNLSWKQIWILNAVDNFGYIISGGIMTSAPLPYLYSVGGYYNLRGFIDNRQVGPYQVRSSVEYRTLLTEKRVEFFDLDQLVVQGVLFQDIGSAWGEPSIMGDEQARKMNLLWSVGAGIRLNFVKIAGAVLRLDLAKTLRPEEGYGFSFGAGQFF